MSGKVIVRAVVSAFDNKIIRLVASPNENPLVLAMINPEPVADPEVNFMVVFVADKAPSELTVNVSVILVILV